VLYLKIKLSILWILSCLKHAVPFCLKKSYKKTKSQQIQIAIIEAKIKEFEKKHGPLTKKQKRHIMNKRGVE
jgi:hypothetical protein